MYTKSIPVDTFIYRGFRFVRKYTWNFGRTYDYQVYKGGIMVDVLVGRNQYDIMQAVDERRANPNRYLGGSLYV